MKRTCFNLYIKKIYKFENEVGIDKKDWNKKWWFFQHSSVRKSLHTIVRIFLLSYAVMPSVLLSVLFIDPYFIFKFINFNILVYLVFNYSMQLYDESQSVLLHHLHWYNTRFQKRELLKQRTNIPLDHCHLFTWRELVVKSCT